MMQRPLATPVSVPPQKISKKALTDGLLSWPFLLSLSYVHLSTLDMAQQSLRGTVYVAR